MIRSEEVELKLELQAGDVAPFRALPLLGDGARPGKLQVSTYYDTPDGELRKAGYSLRLRRKGERLVQTVKRRGDSGGFSARAEWEQDVEGPALDFTALRVTPVHALLGKRKLKDRLVPVSETRVTRTEWLLEQGAGAVELILDEGEVEGGGRREAICEIELELKRGQRRYLFDLAREIGAEVPLRMGVATKSDRGFQLLDDVKPRVRKADPVALTAAMSVADALAAIVQSCLRHFRLNEALAGTQRNAGALHQARVAIRRLRSAFSLFGPAIAGDEADRLKSELRWLAALLGTARNLDVLLAAGRGSGDGALAAAERVRLRAEREAAYDAVAAALASKRVPALILDVVAWAESGDWRAGPLADRPIAGFAEERLDKRWRRVRKSGRDIAALTPEERHRLRIDSKKLRYATEFFAGLAAKGARRRRKAFTAALRDLQEQLGALNDIETARELAPAFAPAEDPAALLEAAQRDHDRLRGTGPYWR